MIEILAIGTIFGILVWGVSGSIPASALLGGGVACLCLLARFKE